MSPNFYENFIQLFWKFLSVSVCNTCLVLIFTHKVYSNRYGTCVQNFENWSRRLNGATYFQKGFWSLWVPCNILSFILHGINKAPTWCLIFLVSYGIYRVRIFRVRNSSEWFYWEVFEVQNTETAKWSANGDRW